jgi:DNA-binding beta-propeller fold protein YncE
MAAFRTSLVAAVLALAAAAVFVARPLPEAGAARTPAPTSNYTLFESGQVRPLALSPNGRLLFACNTPDNRLEVLRVSRHGLRPLGSIPVGLEPVAVAARSDREAWVVNHLSDSVSIVRLRDDLDGGEGGDDLDLGSFPRKPAPGWVARTLLVGDEPRDVVFAGSRHPRAFITTAHRGQNAGFDPGLLTPGLGRADVWVFDAEQPGGGLGGEPLTRITLFCDTPRALAATPDGSRVYAAGFLTGNRTTSITEGAVTPNGGTPPPQVNHAGVPQAPTGLIVKFNGSHWVDELGRVWDSQVKFSLPDKDVFAIDADANPPVATASFSGVGTVLFNMVVNPVNGRVYVSNTDAHNDVRFEGPGLAGHTVRGHLAESRITVLGAGVEPRHLNKHINFADCCNPNPSEENAKSLAFPLDLQISRDGSTLYVAAFGSGKVGVFSTAALEADTFVPDLAEQIVLSGGGPSGLALDERRGRLYVLTRFNNSISIVDTSTKHEIGSVTLFSPEPAHIVRGRRFLYDASFSSAHGDSACASCHIFGDFDALAWDLGVPENDEIPNAGIFTVPPEPFGVSRNFQALKGPMTTQSLRGLANHGAMHWRGDRQNNSEPSVQPDQGAFDEFTAFMKFNVAFPSLTGRNEQIPAADMEAFTRFVLEITYPPNPIRRLDDSLTPEQQAGRDLFFNPARKTDSFFECNGCHVLKRDGNAEFGVAKPGFFGSDGRFSFENEPQTFKIPHLRNLYQKVGMFGMARAPFFLPESLDPAVDNAFMGDQIRGFGYLHDGSCDTVFRFHNAVAFMQRPPGFIGPQDPGNPTGIPLTPEGTAEKLNLSQFMLAFDSNLKPIVGQQVTFTADNQAAALPRLELMMARADAGDCELVAKRGNRGYLYQGSGKFQSDRHREGLIPEAELRALSKIPGGEVTFTCVPPGSGRRIGIDRDDDGVLDGDE